MPLIFDPYLRKRASPAGRSKPETVLGKYRSVDNFVENIWTYSNVRNSPSDQTSITYSIAPNCSTHPFERPEVSEPAYMRWPFENRKAVQGPSDSESHKVQVPFGIENESCFPCLVTPSSLKRINSSLLIWRATGCFRWSPQTKRTNKKRVIPIESD